MLKSSQLLSISRLVLTPGEPAGIGPELVVRMAQEAWPVELVVSADPELLKTAAKNLHLPLQLFDFNPTQIAQPHRQKTLQVLPTMLATPAIPGILDTRNADYVLTCLRKAAMLAYQSPTDTALVTGPIHKSVLKEAGFNFLGHTEFLEDLSNSQAVMMLASPVMRVALVTTHLPLKDVASAITQPHLEQVLRVVDSELRRRFNITAPRIAVCGLNPHAGESGYLGREEIDVIEPVLHRLRSEGLHLIGPQAADTAFTKQALSHCDIVVAMYHDQGLSVLKHQGFGQAVNISLGLPFIRTSVDHGSGLSLAGKGTADPGSLYYAMNVAIQMLAGHA